MDDFLRVMIQVGPRRGPGVKGSVADQREVDREYRDALRRSALATTHPMLMRSLAIVLMGIGLLTACAGPPTHITPPALDTFTDESESFLIAYPRDWVLLRFIDGFDHHRTKKPAPGVYFWPQDGWQVRFVLKSALRWRAPDGVR